VRITAIPARELTDDHVARWSELQLADADLVSPFFRPEFTQAVAAARDDVCVAILEDAGRPAGYFPFQRGRWGIGKPVGASMSDYQGAVAERSLAIDPAALLRACRLRMWDFDHLPTTQRAFAGHHAEVRDSPYLDLSEGFAAYSAARAAAGSKVVKKTDRQARVLAKDHGELRFEADESDPAILRQLLDWKSDQYRRTGAPDVFAARWRVDLIERILAARTPTFAGVLSTLRAGERLVAVHLGMRSATALHSWFPAYDPEFSQYSPGLVLLLELARVCEQWGMTMLDLGRGDAAYKTRLMSGSVPVAQGAVALPGPLAAGRRARAGLEQAVRGSRLSDPARQAVRWLRRRRASAT
jgi:CelD/BcsL family acetyltransferase involved in cellulose biosynthesis